MKKKFNKNYLEKYSRQIVLKDIGILGQKKISLSKILIVGLGGLGCPAVDYLCRAGVGQVGLVDFDKVSLSNIHRQGMYNSQDVGKLKVDVIYTKIKKIDPDIKIIKHKVKITNKNFDKIAKKYYETEASGNITLKNIKAVASTGVNRISVGSITHSAPAIDFKLEI